eukprot:3898558-Amphidinium_carterae.1
MRLDGVAITSDKRNGLLCFTICNLFSGNKWVWGAVRKSTLCKCSCKGWCTIWHFMQLVRWSMEALAEGNWPNADHLGQPFPDESFRQQEGRNPFPLACLVQIKGDWAEWSHPLGLPSWQSSSNPCPMCLASRDGMLADLPLANCNHNPFPAKSPMYMLGECSNQSLEMEVGEDEWQCIEATLMYDTRRQGAKGRCLTTDMEEYGLQAGDRLEPSIKMPDVGFTAPPSEFPITLTWWKGRRDECSRHLNRHI